MKIKSTFAKLLMLSVFGVLLHSCTTDENEILPERSKNIEIELAHENYGKANDTMPNDNEPVIVRPRT